MFGPTFVDFGFGCLGLTVKVEGCTRIHHGFVRRLMVEYLQVEMVYVWNLRVCSCSNVMFEVRVYFSNRCFTVYHLRCFQS